MLFYGIFDVGASYPEKKNMKYCVFLLLLLSGLSAKGKDLELKTTIEGVTVFRNGAQVTRTGTLSIPVGEHLIKVKNVSPLLLKESIQVNGEGTFTLLSVNYQQDYTEQTPAADIRALEAREQEVRRKLEEIQVKLEVLRSEEEIISTLKKLILDQPNAVDQVIKAQETARVRLTQIKTEQLRLGREQKQLQQEEQRVSQELSAKKLPKAIFENAIVIKVAAKQESRASFTVNYLVQNARWYATYDIRVNDISQPLSLRYKANISQQTGEDWNKVKLTLSSGDPSVSSEKPQLQAWWLRLNEAYAAPRKAGSNFDRYSGNQYLKLQGRVTDEYGDPLAFANVMVVGSTIGAATDMEGFYMLTLPPNAKQVQVSYIGYKTTTLNISGEKLNVILPEEEVRLEEVVITKEASAKHSVSTASVERAPVRGARGRNKTSAASVSVPVVTPVENIIQTEFSIEQPYTIPSDTRHYTVEIQELELPATYQYYCAPRIDKEVFLTARLTQWDQYNLLEGQAQVFFEGTYVGQTLIDVKYLSDTLEIALGRDKHIQVERQKIRDYQKKQWVGSDRFVAREWEIKVRNGKKQKISLLLEDQFPLTADSRIEVKQEERSGGKLEEKTGIVSWHITLEPSQTETRKLRYTVKHPKGYWVGLD